MLLGTPRVPPGFSLEMDLRRDRRGRWFHNGELVRHRGLARCFDTWVDRHENGRYVVKNDVNWAFVAIEGAPVWVRRVEIDGDEVRLQLSDERAETLDPRTLRQDADGALYCQVRQGRLTAMFGRQAMFDLADVVDEDEAGVFLELPGGRVQPPVVSDPIQ